LVGAVASSWLPVFVGGLGAVDCAAAPNKMAGNDKQSGATPLRVYAHPLCNSGDAIGFNKRTPCKTHLVSVS
jgi:hypothetical protein